MNDWDRDNLEFLMALGTHEFDAWMEQADNEDIEYARELIRQARTELMVEEMDLKDIQEFYDKPEEFTEAKAVLGKFMLS